MATILFIDDEDGMLRRYKEIMADTEHQVYTANNPECTLHCWLTVFTADVIVVDYRMPQMTGIEFIEKALDIIRKPCKFLLLSTMKVNEQHGADQFLSKNLLDEELLPTVNELLNQLKQEGE